MASKKGFNTTIKGFSYVLAACVISAVYTLLQNLRHFNYLSTGNLLLEACASNLVDFLGDQIVAYLLLSSASAATPSIELIRGLEKSFKSFGATTKGSSVSSASTAMAFLAFFPLALSAMISGYKLSTKTYV
ncbi:CASP-like protein 4B4 [Papaver somniferum]|uniref:CASP-like protein 4B4 n=1 Tax=Papaver somniferum TaxID=3469 RepID=UPI000E704EDA|nr:CASP-like protein 4B4 [Papaver somniferum]